MGPVRLNRRRFLGCSAAAGLAISQSLPVEAAAAPRTVRLGMIGLGNRGTSLLRNLLELPGVEVRSVCDIEPKHRQRAQGIAEKATGRRPEAFEQASRMLDDEELDAVVSALPCDLHAASYLDVLRAGKHLYAEKPLALSLDQCDALIVRATGAPIRWSTLGFSGGRTLDTGRRST